jgi:hypothetical protein
MYVAIFRRFKHTSNAPNPEAHFASRPSYMPGKLSKNLLIV